MRKLIKKCLLLVVLGFLTHANCFSQKNNSDFKQAFQNPAKQYYPTPFWHINGEMTDAEIVRQMNDAHTKAKFNGVAILPVGNTKPTVLSDGFFDRYITILETAKKRNDNVILYDDAGFPSGTAGGQLEKKFPQHVRKSLEKREIIPIRAGTFKAHIPKEKLLAVVAMNTKTLERVNLKQFIDADNDFLTWKVPTMDWKIIVFTIETATFFKQDYPVDYLDTVAIEKFMTLTYDRYAEKFNSYFGNTIQLVFFDDVGFLRSERSWTGKFNEKFKAIYGVDPDIYYPALWYNIGPETEAARVALFNTRAELMAEGYPKMVTKFTKKYNLKSTGHPPGNYGIQPVDMSGDIFKYYRYTDLPLTDLIIAYGRGRDGFKLISSASDYYDRPITATEIYGALPENTVDSAMLYRALMEIQARGVNFVIPHGMWYDPTKVSIPPLISPFSEKLAPALPKYSDFVARTCYMLQGGRKIADIGLIYPIESLQAGYYFDAPENNNVPGTWAYPEADYLKVSDMLTNDIRRDFTFIHPEFLASDKYLLQKNKIHLNNTENYQDYNLLIIPSGKVISLKTLEKIKQFYDNGGKVIATTLLPSVSAEFGQNDKVVKIIAEIFGTDATSTPILQTNKMGGKALFITEPTAEKLAASIDLMTPNADVIFGKNALTTSELGKFSYIHKVHNGKDIYFFANSSDNNIDTEVLLRGKMKLESLDPHSGAAAQLQKVSYIKQNGETYTKCRLTLKAVSAVFWVSK